MRIYYFGELISDTEAEMHTAPIREAAPAKKATSEPRLIRDILTERPYIQKTSARVRSARARTFGPSFLPSTFTVRNYSHA